jgi:hypothetical protein
MFNLQKELIGLTIQELGYSRLRVLSFRLDCKKITDTKSRIAILRRSIRKKYKNSSLRVRSKDYVILSYTQENLEPYYISKKLNPNEVYWLESKL